MEIKIKQNNIEFELIENFNELHWFRIINFDESSVNDIDILVEKFNKIVKENKIEVLTSDSDRNKDTNTFLKKTVLKVHIKKAFYTKELKNHHFKNGSFTYNSINNFSEDFLLDLFAKITEGDPDIEADTNKEYKEMIALSEDKNYNKNWKVVLKEDQIIGMVFPQVYQDDLSTGSLFYIGLLPEYRGHKFSQEIHAKGLQFLKENGAKNYIGSTVISNHAMINVFKKNECIKDGTQLFYK